MFVYILWTIEWHNLNNLIQTKNCRFLQVCLCCSHPDLNGAAPGGGMGVAPVDYDDQPNSKQQIEQLQHDVNKLKCDKLELLRQNVVSGDAARIYRAISFKRTRFDSS
jgi:hypothetical protein